MQNSSNSTKLVIVIVLILVSALYRLFPHPYNFAPITGMALLSGAFLKDKRVFAVLLPLVALFVTDVILNNTLYKGFYADQGFVLFQPYMIATYFSLILMVIIGASMKKIKFFAVLGASLFSSVLFFVITNFASWLQIPIYPKNMAGLMECFIAGIPFFPFTLLGDVVFSLALFGIAMFALKVIRDHLESFHKEIA